MTVRSVRVEGAQAIIERLGAYPNEIKKAARTSLNRQATATRKKDIVEPLMQDTKIARAVLNKRLPIDRANQTLIAKIKANQGGIPVPAYTTWAHEPTGKHPTRHRITVGWPGGERKVAAGFVNPFGTYQAPLTTRLKGVPLGVALGPSVAAMRKAVYADAEMQKTSRELAERFAEFLDDIVNSRPVPEE